MTLCEKVRNAMYTTVFVVGSVGAAVSSGYALYQNTQKSNIENVAYERLPIQVKRFRSNLRYSDLAQEEIEQVEKHGHRIANSMFCLLTSFGLAAYGGTKLNKVDEDEGWC